MIFIKFVNGMIFAVIIYLTIKYDLTDLDTTSVETLWYTLGVLVVIKILLEIISKLVNKKPKFK